VSPPRRELGKNREGGIGDAASLYHSSVRQEKDSANTEIDFERVHTELIAPALKDAGLGGGTTGEIIEPEYPEDMFGLIIEADLVVCDITVHNANVFYELGIRHALRKKHSVLIKGGREGCHPFDVLTDRYLPYDINDPGSKRKELGYDPGGAGASARPTVRFSRCFDLPEVDPAAVQVVPKDLTEEWRAPKRQQRPAGCGYSHPKWKGAAFQWRRCGYAQAQWDVADYEGARRTWRKSLRTTQTTSPRILLSPISMSASFGARGGRAS